MGRLPPSYPSSHEMRRRYQQQHDNEWNQSQWIPSSYYMPAPRLSGSGREHSYSARRRHHPYRESAHSYHMPAPRLSGSGREHSYSARRKHHPYRENAQSYYTPVPRLSASGREHAYSARKRHYPYSESAQSCHIPAPRLSGSGRSYSSCPANNSYGTHFLPAPRFMGGYGPGEEGFAGMFDPEEDGAPTRPAAASLLPSLDVRIGELRKLHRDVLVGERKMILIMCLEHALAQIIKDDASVMAYEGVFQMGNLFVKMRPYLKEMLTTCSDRYEFILFCDFPTPFVEDFARQNMEIAELCKMRIFSKDDVNGNPTNLLKRIPRASFDLILSLVHSSRKLPGPMPVYVSKHQFFFTKTVPTVSPGAVIFSRQCKTRIPCHDEDNKQQLRRTQKTLIQIHQARYPHEGEPLPPDAMEPALKKCSAEAGKAHSPRSAPPSMRQTVDKMMALDTDRLVQERKMILLVDLDNTVMNSCPDVLASRMIGTIPIVSGFQLKIRPGVSLFLQKCAKLYELIVVTMGSNDYAADIVALLDGDKKLFKNRIVSRNDLRTKHSKEEVFGYFQPAARDFIVIIDDSESVWMNLKSRHLIKVKPYQVFHSEYAFDEETTMQVLRHEKETGQKARVQAEDTDNHYLTETLLGKLQEIHGLCYQGDECDPSLAGNKIIEWNNKRAKTGEMRMGCPNFQLISADSSSTGSFPKRVKTRAI